MSQFRGVVGAQAGKEIPPGTLGTWRAMLLAHCPLLGVSSLELWGGAAELVMGKGM